MLNQNQNKILIKDRSGQMKTVNLNLGGITAPSVKQQTPITHQPTTKSIVPTVGGINSQNVSENKLANNNAAASINIQKKIVPDDKLDVPNVIAKEMTMPGFYFHREDEEEVAKFKNKDEIIDHKKKEVVLSYIIDEIVKKSNLNLELGARDRLNRVIESRLREIRDLIETKEALLKPRNTGGAGLDENQVKGLLKNIEEYRLKMHNGQNLEAEIINLKKEIEKPVDHTKTDLAQETPEKISLIKDSVLPKILKSATNLPHVASAQEIVAPQNIKKINSTPTPEVAKENFNDWIKKTSVRDDYQPRMVSGPLEELATIDLNYFRQLGANPLESVAKIKHKIDLLTQDSFARRMEGIKSWRQSPVYRNYLAIGSLSVEGNQGIDEVIKQKQLNNQPCLTLEEFEAVADLNQEISY